MTFPTLAPFRCLADRHSLPEPGGALIGRAEFSTCGHYRWWLQRLWRPEARRLLFIGLNPSRADGLRDDPTLRRLIGFARSWGYGGLEVLNLFARVSASPTALRRCRDPIGGRCDAWIRHRWRSLDRDLGAGVSLWLGWGNGGAWRERDRQVLTLLAELGCRPLSLGLTAAGHPRHPLYLPSTGRLEAFAPSWNGDSATATATATAIDTATVTAIDTVTEAPPCPASPVATPST